MAKLFNVQTRKEETVPEDKLNEAIASGTHSYKAGEKVNVVDPNGKSYSVDASELPIVMQEGFRVETPTQIAVREYVKENEGLKGATKVALGQFADEALMGIPEIIYDKTADPLEVAKKDALKKDHEIANTLGGVAGFGASLTVGGPLFKGASTAGKLVERGIAERLATAGMEQGTKATAKQLATRIASKAAGMGVEGAIISAPRAITEASLGDPELAAETIMMGGLGGALLGGGGEATKSMLKATGSLTQKGMDATVPKVLEKFGGLTKSEAGLLGQGFGDQNFMKMREAVANKDKATFASELSNLTTDTKVIDHAWDKLQTSINKKPDQSAGELLGTFAGLEYLIPGLGKLYGAYQVGKKGIEVAQSPIKTLQGLLYAEKAMKATGKALDSIPNALDELVNKASRGQVSSSTSSVGAIARMLGEDGKLSKKEQFEKMSKTLADLQGNPNLTSQKAAELSMGLANSGAPGIADAYTRKNMLVAQYLQDNIPKNPFAPTPFKKVDWKPSDQELSAFERKVHAIQNPMSILDDMAKGTLSKESVDAVKTVYPVLYSKIQDKVTDYFINNKKPIPYSARIKLSLLMDQPFDNDLQPQNIKAYQNTFVQPDQGQKAQPNQPLNMPSSASDMQKLQIK